MDISIAHISESDFEMVCQDVVKTHPGFVYYPPLTEWKDYPDIGYSTLSDCKGTTITRGHHNYSHTPNGDFTTEDCILVSTPSKWGESVIIDTQDQLRKLIKETFKLKS